MSELLPADEEFSDLVSHELNKKRNPSNKVFVDKDELIRLIEIAEQCNDKTVKAINCTNEDYIAHTYRKRFIEQIKSRLEKS